MNGTAPSDGQMMTATRTTTKEQNWTKQRGQGKACTVSHKAHIFLRVHLKVSGILAMELLGLTIIFNHRSGHQGREDFHQICPGTSAPWTPA